MNRMTDRNFLLLNITTFIFFTFLIISYTLAIFSLFIAFIIIIVNLYNIINTFLILSQASTLNLNHKNTNINQFQKKVRQAYDKSMRKQVQSFRLQDHCWGKNYNRPSEQIQELRKISLAEEYKNSTIRRDSVLHKDEGSSAKRIRSFFAEKKDDLFGSEEGKKRLILQLKDVVTRQINKKINKNIVINELQIKSCIKVMEQFISIKLQSEMDQMIKDFQAVDKFLNRCFSINLTLHRPTSQQVITYAQLRQMIGIIQKKHVIPSRFTSNLSISQIRQRLTQVRQNLTRLPNFILSSNVLKLVISLNHLRKQFPDISIIFGDFNREDRQTEKHIIRLQQDRFFYHNEPLIKTSYVSIILFLIVLHLLPKYQKTNKYLIRQISMQLGIKFS